MTRPIKFKPKKGVCAWCKKPFEGHPCTAYCSKECHCAALRERRKQKQEKTMESAYDNRELR